MVAGLADVNGADLMIGEIIGTKRGTDARDHGRFPAGASPLEHFPTNLAHRDCRRKPLGKEACAGLADCPFKQDDAVRGPSCEPPSGAGPFWPICCVSRRSRCDGIALSTIPTRNASRSAMTRALGQNRLRHGEPDWSESALSMPDVFSPKVPNENSPV